MFYIFTIKVKLSRVSAIETFGTAEPVS